MEISVALKKISDVAHSSAKELDIKLDKIIYYENSDQTGSVEISVKRGPDLIVNYFNIEHEVHFCIKKGEPYYDFAILMGDTLSLRRNGNFIPSYSI